MTPVWLDSHCHVQTAAEGADAVLERARAAGVGGFVCVGTDLESSRQAVALADAHPDVRATVGLHPHDASRLDAEWAELEELATGPRVAAVGETGFDLHYLHSSHEAQEAAFRIQIRLAHRLGKTLVIHTREAWDDTWRVLVDEGVPATTVFHCFTGGPVEAERALELGAHLSFSGIVTFKNAADVRAAAALVPLQRLLVETDSPYLAPVPHRGRENEPAYVGLVGEAVATASGRSVDDVARATAAVTRRAFGLPGAGETGAPTSR